MHRNYDIGKHKIKKELDCVNLLKTIRELKLMMKILIPEHQRLLIKYNKTNLLDETSSGSDAESKINPVILSQSNNTETYDTIKDRINDAFDLVEKNQADSNNFKVMMALIKKDLSDDSDYDSRKRKRKPSKPEFGKIYHEENKLESLKHKLLKTEKSPKNSL